MFKRTEDEKLMIATQIVDNLLERQQNKQEHKRFQIFAIVSLVTYLAMNIVTLETYNLNITEFIISKLF